MDEIIFTAGLNVLILAILSFYNCFNFGTVAAVVLFTALIHCWLNHQEENNIYRKRGKL